MTGAYLRFQQSQPAGAGLRFGAIDNEGQPFIAIGMVGALPAAAFDAALAGQEGLVASMAVAFAPAFSTEMATTHDNAVPRGPHALIGGEWKVAVVANVDVDADDSSGRRQEGELAVVNGTPAAEGAEVDHGWRPMDISQRPINDFSWCAGLPFGSEGRVMSDAMRSAKRDCESSWSLGLPVGALRGHAWRDLNRDIRPASLVPWSLALAAGFVRVALFRVARPASVIDLVRWQAAMQPRPGISTIPNPPHPDDGYKPPRGDQVALIFRTPWTGSAQLRFSRVTSAGNPKSTIVVPILARYYVVNTQSLTLASSGDIIPCNGLSLSIDTDSWVWGWQTSVPAAFLSVLQADPGDLVELIASVNGHDFRLSVERIQRDRRFAKATLAISGRGRAAWLAAPYAPVVNRTNATTMTAQQLMADALTENGAALGWAIDWNITDWTVPAGAWSHSGTSMEACLAIAEAAGAYIQAHPTAQTLHVLPRYPAAPWNWSNLVPDYDLPEDVCVTEGIEWVDKPAYNTVFVAGQAQGVLGHVTRGGTDGGLASPMVTDPLITHADAARQRGIAILSDTGRQALITLSLPVLEETGIITPGKIVRYHEGGKTHIGLSRGVEVAAQFPKVRQSIRLETHVL